MNEPARRAEGAHREPRLDERRDQDEGAGEVGRVHPQDRLPRQVARLDRPGDQPRQLLRQRRSPRTQFNYGWQLAKIGKPVDQTEWGMTPQTVNAYYNPLQQRDHVPGRDPAAAVLRPQGRRRAQLRRHRRGDRPRDDARLRRPGQPLRAHGQLRELVDEGRCREVHGADRQAGRAVRRLYRGAGDRTSTAS